MSLKTILILNNTAQHQTFSLADLFWRSLVFVCNLWHYEELCNHGQKICRLFRVIEQLTITKKWMYGLPHDLRGSLEIIRIPSIPSWSIKRYILRAVLENCEKSAVKHFIGKPILLNFVNFSTVFLPRLWFSRDSDTKGVERVIYFERIYTIDGPVSLHNACIPPCIST